jgi:hypothetical protein
VCPVRYELKSYISCRSNSVSKGLKSKRKTEQTESFLVGFLYGSFFDLEDGNSTFVSNISELLPDYMALHLRRRYSS